MYENLSVLLPENVINELTAVSEMLLDVCVCLV